MRVGDIVIPSNLFSIAPRVNDMHTVFLSNFANIYGNQVEPASAPIVMYKILSSFSIASPIRVNVLHRGFC